MRSIVIAIVVAFTPLVEGTFDSAVADECRISDSALCLANPNCHWDYNQRGCAQGPAQAQDACASHSDKSVCEMDTTLGCAWSSDKNECASKPK